MNLVEDDLKGYWNRKFLVKLRECFNLNIDNSLEINIDLSSAVDEDVSVVGLFLGVATEINVGNLGTK